MQCEACGAAQNRDAKQWLAAHERWVYDDAARVQRLGWLICLCADCHTVTHYGYARSAAWSRRLSRIWSRSHRYEPHRDP